MIAHPLTLKGQVVTLVPLQFSHIPALIEIARQAPEMYRYTSTPITDTQAEAYFSQAFIDRKQGTAYPFTVLLNPREPDEDARVLGTTRLADIKWAHKNLELGFTWFDRAAMGLAVNVESKYLLFQYVFEELNFLRIQIHVDTRNTRSEAAIRALGAHYEGKLRSQAINKDGYVRDSFVFSVIDKDWPEVKTHLKARIKAKMAASTASF